MSVIEIDVDLIKNNLLSNISNASSSFVSADKYIYFPGSDYGWSSVRSTIGSCSERLSRYKSFISRVSSSMQSKMDANTQSIDSVSIDEVAKSNIVVNGK